MKGKMVWWKLVLSFFLLNGGNKSYSSIVNTEDQRWTYSFFGCNIIRRFEMSIDTQYHHSSNRFAMENENMIVNEGCFRLTRSILEQATSITDNSPSLCSIYCQQHIYFILQGTFCICINHILSLQKVNASNCWNGCVSQEQFPFVHLYRQTEGLETFLNELHQQPIECSFNFHMSRRSNQTLRGQMVWITTNSLEDFKECKTTVLGTEYNGVTNVTLSGRICQRWESNVPHGSLFKNLPENYCRNPDNTSEGPWCYTMDTNLRWEYCGVPFCHTIENLYTNSCVVCKTRSFISVTPVPCYQWTPLLCFDGGRHQQNIDILNHICQTGAESHTTIGRDLNVYDMYWSHEQTTTTNIHSETTVKSHRSTDIEKTSVNVDKSTETTYQPKHFSTITEENKNMTSFCTQSGQVSVHLFIQVVSGISLLSFCLGIAVVILLVARFKKQKKKNPIVLEEIRYMNVQNSSYDHFQISTTHTNTCITESQEEESHYVEIT